ncbi:MAG: DUF4296 domain-containing protein [Saprospiraceae bacterium]|nr:DUF4296 domain-containing protein [Saprospiraceae bacterium]
MSLFNFKNIGFLSLLFLGLMACQKEEKVSLPYPDKKVVDILVDIHVAEAALQPLFGDIKDSTAQVYYQQIYEIHQINEDQLRELLQILKDHPKEMDRIYELVLEEISRQKANIKE